MAEYDPDRIAALAAGALDPAEAAALEADIAADPRAAAELAAQRLALDTLRRAPAPVLSAAERTELHRAVAAALHLEEAPQAVPAPAVRRRAFWRPAAVAAAALAALVAAVPLFGLLSSGEEAELAATTILDQAGAVSRDTALAPAEGPEQGLLGDGLFEANATTEITSTTAASITSALPESRWADPADKTVQELIAQPAALFAPAPGATLPCGDEARILLRTEKPSAALVPLSDGDGQLVVWFLSADGDTVQQLVAFAPETCEFLAAYP